jgi:hypothetical protein
MTLLSVISNLYYQRKNGNNSKLTFTDTMTRYNCRGCNRNLTSNNPASIYQRQKIIQNTVRVNSSLYAMNLAALSTYQPPSDKPQLINGDYIVPANVYWNQMSDRARPSRQLVKNTNTASSTRHTITRHRPGALSPGGDGVDIKHNYYGRYLNKLKQGSIRRGSIPSNFGGFIPFNDANPIYGGKIMKLSIINSRKCNCDNDNTNLKKIYENASNYLQEQIMAVQYEYKIGDYVYARKNEYDMEYYKGIITNISNDFYTVQFVDDNSIRYDLSYYDLIIYFACDCIQNLEVSFNS